MPNKPNSGGCLHFIERLGRFVLERVMGSWDATFDENARKYTLFAGGLLIGGILGFLILLLVHFFPFYPIDNLKQLSREAKLIVCFIVIPAVFTIGCFALEDVRGKIVSERSNRKVVS